MSTPEVPATKPTKMARARALLATLSAGPIPEGSSLRKEFISKAVAEIELTKNGAITYYNNLQNELKGKPLYIKPKKAATTAQVQGEEQPEKAELTEEQQAGDAAADAELTGQASDTPVEEEEEAQAE